MSFSVSQFAACALGVALHHSWPLHPLLAPNKCVDRRAVDGCGLVAVGPAAVEPGQRRVAEGEADPAAGLHRAGVIRG